MPAPWRPATADFHTRRKLLLALAAAPLAAALPRMPILPVSNLSAESMTIGEAIAWLHLVGFRTPREQ